VVEIKNPETLSPTIVRTDTYARSTSFVGRVHVYSVNTNIHVIGKHLDVLIFFCNGAIDVLYIAISRVATLMEISLVGVTASARNPTVKKFILSKKFVGL
jgi:hypothetical protein